MSLLDQVEAEVNLINELKDKTMILWNRLDVSAEEREQILMAATKPCGKSVRNLVSNFVIIFKTINFRGRTVVSTFYVQQWTKELERCEKLKKANIETVIIRCREVIKGLWDLCHMDQDERQLFIDYYSDDYNEELLESHEKEEERLRKFYAETRFRLFFNSLLILMLFNNLH